jgi:hypothetical protein
MAPGRAAWQPELCKRSRGNMILTPSLSFYDKGLWLRRCKHPAGGEATSDHPGIGPGGTQTSGGPSAASALSLLFLQPSGCMASQPRRHSWRGSGRARINQRSGMP